MKKPVGTPNSETLSPETLSGLKSELYILNFLMPNKVRREALRCDRGVTPGVWKAEMLLLCSGCEFGCREQKRSLPLPLKFSPDSGHMECCRRGMLRVWIAFSCAFVFLSFFFFCKRFSKQMRASLLLMMIKIMVCVRKRLCRRLNGAFCCPGQTLPVWSCMTVLQSL